MTNVNFSSPNSLQVPKKKEKRSRSPGGKKLTKADIGRPDYGSFTHVGKCENKSMYNKIFSKICFVTLSPDT